MGKHSKPSVHIFGVIVNALHFLQHLKNQPYPFIQTKMLSACLGLTQDQVSKYLLELSKNKMVQKLKNGKWLNLEKAHDPLQLAEFLIAPFESYLSLQTALFYHGIIEQIPSRVYSVTLGRSQTLQTASGIFSYHHVTPDFYDGFTYLKPYLKIATPEKALVDYFYFSPSKHREFSKLPEIELAKKFSFKKAFGYCTHIPSKRTRSLVEKKLNELKET